MEAKDVIELYSLFTKNEIGIWLDGGWGVDALLGEETRKHGDVDIVVQEKDLQKLRKLLGNERYQDIKRDDTKDWNFVLGDKSGRLIDVHVVTFDSQGNGIYGPKERGVMYPAYAFAGKGIVNNFPIRCLTAKYQVESHTGYEIDDNDMKDVAALCKKFGIDYPKEYLKF